MLNPSDVDVVIYHHPCPDGSGAALAAYKYFKEKEKIIKFIGANYNKVKLREEDIINKNVLLCDFSYKKPILLDIISKAKNLLIIDHHKSAQEDLKDIPDKYKIFDMSHSGAHLVFKYFFPNEKIPLLINYIEDFDIFTKKLEHINKYSAWITSFDINYLVLEKYLDDDLFLNTLITEGTALEQKDLYLISKLANYSSCKFQRVNNKLFFIIYLNSNISKSELGNQVLSKFQYADFSAIYNINDYENSTVFSLRSSNINHDCSEVAVALGGGGHRNASSVSVNYVVNCIPGVIYSNNKLYERLEHIYFKDIIIYCQSEDNKSTLGEYLLQERYKDTQEAVNIIKLRDNILINKLLIAAIWEYNYVTKKTNFKVSFDKSLLNNQILEYREKYKLDEDNKIEYDGEVTELLS
jgi:oligoribonuclease NrnB/cAMP/cGMP phosphodiesterase (DHH superfamily)